MPPLEPDDPRQIGAYRLAARLGQGGQGVVYLGHDSTGARVAVKVFHPQLTPDLNGAGTFDTFAREMDAAKQVARFCTAQILDSGTFGDRRFIVSEYVDGPPLSRIVAQQGPRTGSALDRLAVATATALVALHDAGIVHRDLNPNNVLIGADGPRVIDFGISRALSGAQTMVSRAIGTPAYMGPEQLEPGELGPAVDVFAWASTMAFAATGRPPFGNESIAVVFNRIAHGEPNLDGIEEPLRGLLTECFAKDPARRPSARDVLDRLVRRAGRGPALTPAPAAPFPGVPAAPVQGVPAAPVSGFPAAPVQGVPAIPALPADALPPLPPEPVAADAVTAPHERYVAQEPPETGSTRPGPGGSPGRGRRGAVLAGAGGAFVAVVAVAFAVVWAADGGSPRDDARAEPRGSTGAMTGTSTPGANQPGDAARAPASSPSKSPSRSATPRSSVKPSSKPSPTPTRSRPKLVRVELGAGHFSAYCVTLGWEWVEYRDAPSPGAYCVKRKGGVMKLSSAQRDAGCRWRFKDGRARHYFKGKTNYCYTMKPAS
ncbi:serine/threonine protein kinase [Actinomadura spongiicola]|uniref:Serine/threonine protein kinase n=1 Tax=Actinomadura spongiicola TaxID=2303421 RepID=A0A372G8T4_9ACTN|nr:serine/threonine-protein kinase [Actinomadura spongiicola]RFS81808.1 serine/threonine protein kinase [Actinomadura spongiicola]